MPLPIGLRRNSNTFEGDSVVVQSVQGYIRGYLSGRIEISVNKKNELQTVKQVTRVSTHGGAGDPNGFLEDEAITREEERRGCVTWEGGRKKKKTTQ